MYISDLPICTDNLADHSNKPALTSDPPSAKCKTRRGPRGKMPGTRGQPLRVGGYCLLPPPCRSCAPRPSATLEHLREPIGSGRPVVKHFGRHPDGGDRGTCPGSNESAGRVKSTRTRSGNPYLTGALGVAPMSRGTDQGHLPGGKYRRIASQGGPVTAIVAVEHAILTAIMKHDHPWHLLPRPPQLCPLQMEPLLCGDFAWKKWDRCRIGNWYARPSVGHARAGLYDFPCI